MTSPLDAHLSPVDRHHAGCIYCGRLGPYSDEHVVSAGLGGDDPAWMLRGCVCSVCNATTFSRLEAHVLKASPIALARLFLQPTTRDGTPPSPLQAYTTVELTDGGRQAAGDLGAGGQSSVFAQVLFERGEAGQLSESLVGPDRTSIEALFTALRERLGDEVVLIEKHAAQEFTTTVLTWAGNRYQAGASALVRKPPAVGIWFEPEYVPTTAASPPPWTLFRRPTGQLVGRAPDLAHIGVILSLLRLDLDVLASTFEQAKVEAITAQAGVNMHMLAELHTLDRTMIKIGLNLAAHLFGEEIVRRSDFDAAVEYVLGHGEPIRRAQLPSHVLGPSLRDRHVFHLGSYRSPNGRPALVLMLRLYDTGPIDSFVLAEFAAPPPRFQPIVIHVDYTAHRIEHMSLADHLVRTLQQ